VKGRTVGRKFPVEVKKSVKLSFEKKMNETVLRVIVEG
jgi:hypothetical protein